MPRVVSCLYSTSNYCYNLTTSIPCVPYPVDKFPKGFMTHEQRMKGGIVVHFFVAFYLSSVTAIISERYCVPALELTVHHLDIRPQLGNAIILPISTASAELSACIIGAFITHNNIGMGAVVGTSAFNLLIFTMLSTFSLKKKTVTVDWYPVTRDAVLFCCSIIMVILFLMDGIIEWWEASILSSAFVIYVVAVCLDRKMESLFRNMLPSTNGICNDSLVMTVVDNAYEEKLSNFGRAFIDIFWMKQVSLQIQEEPGRPSEFNMLALYVGSKIWWILMWPASIILYLTIPNCKAQKCRKFFPVTFIISAIWIGACSYINVWMTTIIGYTLGIPIAVAGVIILAVGASIPQIVFGATTRRRRISADVIVTHQLQSNIFGTLLCLGIPWLIRCLVVEKDMKIFVNDQTIVYTFTTLLCIVVTFWTVLSLMQWKLSWKIGLVCLILFAILIMFICFYQLNVIGDFSTPWCRHE